MERRPRRRCGRSGIIRHHGSSRAAQGVKRPVCGWLQSANAVARRYEVCAQESTGTIDPSPEPGVGSFRPIAALKRTFNSLGVTSYRNLWIGFLLQMGGMQMLLLTGGYYIYELTGSASLLGIAIASAAIPAVSLALLGGVFADRFEKKRVIQAGQGVSLLVALFVAVSISTGTITWMHLVAASFVQGSAMPLMMPARQAIIPQLVGMNRLQNAIALNSMVMSLSFMAAPTLAGILIAAVGIEAVYYTSSLECMWQACFSHSYCRNW